MIRIIYNDSSEHPSSMTITQVQENSELVISQSININELQHSTLLDILCTALDNVPHDDAEEDGYGGATYTWVFEDD